ncbi:MAG: NAD(P)-dependent oxidoreductase [Gammaproteobacteria bacterium]|nr:NAD(P)-dependent oxidoreductase [Gammaproteobacteria bacterium]
MRIAVTGATGLVGEFLIPRLLEDDHVVHALWRSEKRWAETFEPNKRLRWFQGDLMDMRSLETLVVDCDAVVHAALEHQPGRYRGGEGDDPTRFKLVNLKQTEALLKMLQSTQVTRTVFISSRAVFDGRGKSNASLPDSTPTKPVSLYGEIKARTEALGDALSNIGFCTLRPTGIYGATRRPQDNKWSELISHVSDGDGLSREYSNQLRTEVHGDDVASAILLLLTAPVATVEHRHFNCSDIAVSQAQLVDLMRQIKDGHTVDLESLPTGTPPTNPMLCDGLLGLGWKPGGMAKLVAALRQMLVAPI